MTHQAPGAAELQEIGELLARYWPGAKATLRIYLTRVSPWSMAHRDIKVILQEMLRQVRSGAAVKVPLHVRDKAMAFAGAYGTITRTTAADPLTVRRDLRFSEAEDAAIVAAAKQAGVPVTVYIRAAAVKASQVSQVSQQTAQKEGTT